MSRLAAAAAAWTLGRCLRIRHQHIHKTSRPWGQESKKMFFLGSMALPTKPVFKEEARVGVQEEKNNPFYLLLNILAF